MVDFLAACRGAGYFRDRDGAVTAKSILEVRRQRGCISLKVELYSSNLSAEVLEGVEYRMLLSSSHNP